MSWVAVAGIAVGAGTSLYGANKQKQAQEDANRANQASIANADQSAWNAYLMQRGLYTGGAAPFGVIPQNAQATNARLPLWFNVKTNPAAIAARNPRPTPVSGLNAPAATRVPFIRRKTS